jgi:galactokinase
MQELFREHFPNNSSKIFIGYAPGRLDVMGGIADYSGSLVLQMPIADKTTVVIAPRTDQRVVVKSILPNQVSTFQIELPSLLWHDEINYEFAKITFQKLNEGQWAAYVVGCMLVLSKEKGFDLVGFDVLVKSDVPIGKGVSSSASLEVATMKALLQYFELELWGTELPILAQKVENQIVGVPCGLMDQLACFFGQENALLPIICQPDILQNPIPIPDNLHLIGIDSGMRHFVGDYAYTDVRAGAFMGYSIIARRIGYDLASLQHIRPYGGFLANISVDELSTWFLNILPKEMRGSHFLELYGGTIDDLTQIQPNKYYPIRQATIHPVRENYRVHRFMGLLQEYAKKPNRLILKMMGELMYQSHESYSSCGLGSEPTDELVALSKKYVSRGVFGAKITGGGSGGTVCFLAEGKEGKEAILELYENYTGTKSKKESLFISK